MILTLEKQFNRLETQRKEIQNKLGKLTHAQLNFKPAEKEWSLLQVINHLIYAETNTVKYLNKKIQGLDSVKKSNLLAKLRLFILKLALRLPVKYKAPKAALPVQEEVYILENLITQWDEIRNQFKKILDGFDSKTSQKLLFKHPIAGRFDISQTLNFIAEHIEHHQPQIERIMKSPEFPSK